MLSLTRRALEEFDNSHDFDRLSASRAVPCALRTALEQGCVPR